MKNKYLLPLMTGFCILAVAVMVIALIFGGKSDTPVFTPPPFDSAAQEGMPDVSEESWSRIYQDGMSFAAYVCGRVIQADGEAEVYFTSVEENEVWLKLRILDEGGNILGESGLLRPGEYVKSVTLDKVPESGTKIKLKIMAYEPETYYSAGSVELNTTITGGGA